MIFFVNAELALKIVDGNKQEHMDFEPLIFGLTINKFTFPINGVLVRIFLKTSS